MVNQFQEALLPADRANRTYTMRLAFVQVAIGLALVIAISAFGLFSASHAMGEESQPKAAAANMVPKLVISPESLEPNLNWMPATGDGGAMVEPQETTGGTRTSPRAR